MRIAAIIVATLLLLASAGLGLARSNTNFKDAKELASVKVDKDLVAVAKAAKVDGASVLEIKPGALKRGGVGLILTGVLSLVLLVSVFAKKGTPYLAGALLLAAVVTIVLNPQYEVGSMGPMSARSAAIVVGVLAAGGALFAFLADRIRVRRLGTA